MQAEAEFVLLMPIRLSFNHQQGVAKVMKLCYHMDSAEISTKKLLGGSPARSPALQ